MRNDYSRAIVVGIGWMDVINNGENVTFLVLLMWQRVVHSILHVDIELIPLLFRSDLES